VPSWVCCLLRAGVRRRVSSNDGMFRTGETGTVGLRIDFSGKEAVDYKNSSQNCSAYARAVPLVATWRRLPFEFCRASSPPGPKLLLRDFLSFIEGFELFENGWAAPISVVAFSLSKPDVILDRGT
jgi:hypothetical protein